MEKGNKEIGVRLKKIRSELGLSQREIAEGVSISAPGYNYLENGVNALSSRVLSLLKHVYNVSPDYLLKGEGEMFIKKPPSPLLARIKELEASLERSNAIIDAILGKK